MSAKFTPLLQQHLRDGTVAPFFHKLPPAVTRNDLGKDVRGLRPPKQVEVDTCTLTPPGGTQSGTRGSKYHKWNTQFIGKGIKNYALFLNEAPDFVNDKQAHDCIQFFAPTWSFHVENGIVAGFDDPYASLQTKQTPQSLQTPDTPKCPCGNVLYANTGKCNLCWFAEVVHCDMCQKDKPRGHVCELPHKLKPLCTVVKGNQTGSGRPSSRDYVNINGKKMMHCNLGCKHGTLVGIKSWRRHVQRKHTQGFEFTCHCGFQTNVKNQLKRHQRVHADVYAFPCTLCAKTYKYSEALSAHMRKKHPKEHRNKRKRV
jgi:hypothetical protein